MSCWKALWTALLHFFGLRRKVAVDNRNPESQYQDAGARNLTTATPQCSTRSKYKISVESLEPKDIVIVVMGPTGSGKSSFINMVVTPLEEGVESAVIVGHNLEPCTTEITMVELRDPSSDSRIVLVDTPPFDDLDIKNNDTAILTLIADLLEKTHKKDVKLAGIIYMQKIWDNCKTAGTPLKNLTMLTKLCGEHALKNVILVTTMWDDVEEEQGEERELELKKGYWKGMLNAGSKTFRYTRSLESAWAIMQHFLDPYTFQLHQAKFKTALQSLTQRVDNPPLSAPLPVPLPATKAGLASLKP